MRKQPVEPSKLNSPQHCLVRFAESITSDCVKGQNVYTNVVNAQELVDVLLASRQQHEKH